ncbi:oligoendopeptidase F [Treponema zuelzerae]|uniref:Oligopeptidase F n=1 Tax=Teretinema zuelzerae TaxID=156 RepID=A0AAE3EKM3_9SPIR|nr:oligoendopeptidase F [Teretinema zuelzerae]MCD1655238.1 oligoendopeptidase F [Teretinema zuelzerae]
MKQTTIPARKDVPAQDQWDLSSLFPGDAEWNTALDRFASYTDAVNAYREKLCPAEGSAAHSGGSPADWAAALSLWEEAQRLAERLGNYAFLKKSADESDSANLDRTGRYLMAASAFEAALSWVVPALQALGEDTVRSWISPDAPEPLKSSFAPFAVWIEKLLRLKPFILSEKEERILALQLEAHQAPRNAFSILTNVDIDFGTVKTEKGEEPLSQTTWSKFLENPDRAVRKQAYEKFYGAYDAHKNTLATLYTGSVNQDVATARIRGYSSARKMELFPDHVDEAVYDNLVKTVRSNLAPLHKYYAVRKRALKVDQLRHYDVYVPLVGEIKSTTPYGQAVELITDALAPLGAEYTDTLKKGLLGGWVDRYENKGKRSGAFSSGGYDGYPYILMNYKEEVLRDVFTLAHEGGHSMHSHYSARSNPFMSYNYTIFEAEVASTFNEDLLFRRLMSTAKDERMKAYLLSTRASDILATLYRQTMFAEYEHRAHALVEEGTPLTVELLRSEYRSLLETYFGPEMAFENESDLEGLRIPHFYNAYYVYKYATGISASLALAERVSSGGDRERDDYFAFLKSGGSRYPIDALKVAGVDMQSPAPIEAACKSFAAIVDQLDAIL